MLRGSLSVRATKLVTLMLLILSGWSPFPGLLAACLGYHHALASKGEGFVHRKSTPEILRRNAAIATIVMITAIRVTRKDLLCVFTLRRLILSSSMRMTS